MNMMNTYMGYLLLNLSLVVISFSETNIFIQWGLLELSGVSFIPLIISSGSSSKTKAGLKYFLSQAPASIWILMSVMLFNSATMCETLLPALMFKLALPPFHGWMFSLLGAIGMLELSFLLTLQKFLPLYMMEMAFKSNLILLSIMLTLILLMYLVISISSIKPILLISSISSTFWPVSVLQSGNIWMEFFSIYAFFFMLLCIFMKMKKILDYNFLLAMNGPTRLMLFLQLFNLGGVPPLTGFFLKILIIKSLIMSSAGWVAPLLLMSFLMLYFYLQLLSSVMLLTSSNNKKMKVMTTQMLLMGLMLTPFVSFVMF